MLTLPGYEIVPPQRIVEGASATSHDPAHPPENVLDERDGERYYTHTRVPVSESRGQVAIATCTDKRKCVWLCVAGKWWVTTGGYPQLLVIRFKKAVQVDRVSQRTESRHRLWFRRACLRELAKAPCGVGLSNVWRVLGQVMILCHGTYDVKLSWGDSHAPMDMHHTNAR